MIWKGIRYIWLIDYENELYEKAFGVKTKTEDPKQTTKDIENKINKKTNGVNGLNLNPNLNISKISAISSRNSNKKINKK